MSKKSNDSHKRFTAELTINRKVLKNKLTKEAKKRKYKLVNVELHCFLMKLRLKFYKIRKTNIYIL